MLKPALSLSFLVTLSLGAGCKKEAPPAPAPAPAPPAAGAARIVVNNQGAITVNGQPSSLEQVKALLNGAARPTSIEYSREDRDHDPTPEAAPKVHELLSAIMDSKIPVKLVR
jgi:hypothetical protein